MYDKNNIFAKIIEKTIDAKIVFEDEKILACLQDGGGQRQKEGWRYSRV